MVEAVIAPSLGLSKGPGCGTLSGGALTMTILAGERMGDTHMIDSAHRLYSRRETADDRVVRLHDRSTRFVRRPGSTADTHTGTMAMPRTGGPCAPQAQ